MKKKENNIDKKWNKRQSISKWLDVLIHLIGYTLVSVSYTHLTLPTIA